MQAWSERLKRIRERAAARRARMAALRTQGWTLRRIAEKYRISEARVCQILGRPE